MTTARNLSRRATDCVSVMDFAAIGDGVIDDTAAIQPPINTSDAQSKRQVRSLSGANHLAFVLVAL